jgi:phosphoesterase RecJ-like protein
MPSTPADLARQTITQNEKFLVVSHLRPDGDAVGSVLGLGLALQSVGKDVLMVLEDGVPKSYRHLTGSEQIVKKADGEDRCTIVVDCSDQSRVDSVIPEDARPVLNIDHHNTNLNFAAINVVDSGAAATCQMLAALLPAWGLPISREIAEALLTGIITDTIGFRVASTSPAVLRTAADLFERGADLPTLYAKALLTRSYEAVRYWGAGLSALKLEDRLLWTRLTLEDRRAVNYPGRDDADLVNILQTVEDADVFVIFIEQNDGTVKVSWRARPGFDVSQIALRFGGGGHKPAAGASIQGSLEEVIQKVLDATRPILG